MLNYRHAPRLRVEIMKSPGGRDGYVASLLSYANPHREGFVIVTPRYPSHKRCRWKHEHDIRFYAEVALRDYTCRRPWRFNRAPAWE